jgi:subtilisin family serine protease
MDSSNLGSSIGRRGLGAPGEAVTSLGVADPQTLGGTSVATPFVTGAVALIWSEFPGATAAAVRSAITQAATPRRTTIVAALAERTGGLPGNVGVSTLIQMLRGALWTTEIPL